MKQNHRSSRLQFDSYRSYIPISYDEIEVGVCTQEFAAKIVEALNESESLREQNETLNKAFQMVCTDFVKRLGGNSSQVSKLMRKYLENAKRPEHGSRAIAFMLRDRQRELDVSNQEFARFCNSYRLSPKDLIGIFNGKDVTDEQIVPVARILGKTTKEITEIRDGFSDNEINSLARILGTSTEELSEMFD
jgi:hypothetical protein